MEIRPTKYQYAEVEIESPAEFAAMGFRFNCWQITDLYAIGSTKTVWRVNCVNKQDGSTSTKWFDAFAQAQAYVNDFANNSQNWDFN